MADSQPTTTTKKKANRHVPAAAMHVLASFNNTIVSFSDKQGNVLTSSSAGACGFRGSKKGTAYAAQVASEKAAAAAKNAYGVKTVDVYVRGVGLGREAAVRALQGLGLTADSIQDVTGIPHGGCRPRKQRRA
ncbi:MAG: 30S ribosomal protein S11 [Candidatus Chaera renei]|uniref:Small ribosomal subunit protein uS11 n=1 Tax=Candidatus Chaera renei TaxID=2506947 RepID=A0A4Q0AJ56_9BACT|nr:MAG: 30S ribosomal protein S11 [Candidatus Chaera renei]